MDEVDRLKAELADARKVLLFADGLCVSETGRPISDLYAEDCFAQPVLKAAGCWPRGSFGRDKEESA